MYTKTQFGIELKSLLNKNKSQFEIGKWAFSTYWEHISNLESGIRSIALTLNTMEDGDEFIISYEELNKIADALIDGKDIDL